MFSCKNKLAKTYCVVLDKVEQIVRLLEDRVIVACVPVLRSILRSGTGSVILLARSGAVLGTQSDFSAPSSAPFC